MIPTETTRPTTDVCPPSYGGQYTVSLTEVMAKVKVPPTPLIPSGATYTDPRTTCNFLRGGPWNFAPLHARNVGKYRRVQLDTRQTGDDLRKVEYMYRLVKCKGTIVT